MLRIVIILVTIALTIYGCIDCARTPESDTPGRLPKAAWIALIVLLPIIGPVLWLFFKYQDILTSDAPIGSSDTPRNILGRKQAPSSPVAPDDDPDFLARLEAQNRRKAYEQRKAEEDQAQGKPHRKKHDNDDDESKGLYS